MAGASPWTYGCQLLQFMALLQIEGFILARPLCTPALHALDSGL